MRKVSEKLEWICRKHPPFTTYAHTLLVSSYGSGLIELISHLLSIEDNLIWISWLCLFQAHKQRRWYFFSSLIPSIVPSGFLYCATCDCIEMIASSKLQEGCYSKIVGGNSLKMLIDFLVLIRWWEPGDSKKIGVPKRAKNEAEMAFMTIISGGMQLLPEPASVFICSTRPLTVYYSCIRRCILGIVMLSFASHFSPFLS